MMDPGIRRIPEALKVLLGKPATPPDAALVALLRQIIKRSPACKEAHLPQVFAVSAMPAPRLALVVVIDADQEPQLVAERLNEDIAATLPAGTSIDVWVLESSDHLLPAVRNAGCAF